MRSSIATKGTLERPDCEDESNTILGRDIPDDKI